MKSSKEEEAAKGFAGGETSSKYLPTLCLGRLPETMDLVPQICRYLTPLDVTGGPSIAGTDVTLITNKHQVVDSGGIPTGPIEDYPGVTANKTFTLGEEQPDIDDCFVVNTDVNSIPIDTRSSPLQKLVSFYHPESKIHLEVSSTEPAFQFYTGKYIDVPAVDGQPARGARSGFCVELSPQIVLSALVSARPAVLSFLLSFFHSTDLV